MSEKFFPAERRSDCPVSCVLDLVGDRWSLLVVRDLLGGKRHFDEFLASPEGIASNILTERLVRLAREGFVAKARDPEDGRRFVYELTEKGRELRGLVRLVASWGLRHLEDTAVPPEMARKIGGSGGSSVPET